MHTYSVYVSDINMSVPLYNNLAHYSVVSCEIFFSILFSSTFAMEKYWRDKNEKCSKFFLFVNNSCQFSSFFFFSVSNGKEIE